jgi:hypothetical protein
MSSGKKINENVIMLDHDKSNYEKNTLFIDSNKYELGGLISLFKTEKIYIEANSGLEYAQSHFGDRLAYIENIHAFVIGSNIDDLSDQICFSDNIDLEGIIEFTLELSKIALDPFRIAAVSWEERGIGVYYIKYENDFKTEYLSFDDWEETDLFKNLAKDNGFDIDSDDFYEDDPITFKSPSSKIIDEVYNELLSNPLLFAPDWY